MTYPTSRAGRLLHDRRRANTRNLPPLGLPNRHHFWAVRHPAFKAWVRELGGTVAGPDLPQPVQHS